MSFNEGFLPLIPVAIAMIIALIVYLWPRKEEGAEKK